MRFPQRRGLSRHWKNLSRHALGVSALGRFKKGVWFLAKESPGGTIFPWGKKKGFFPKKAGPGFWGFPPTGPAGLGGKKKKKKGPGKQKEKKKPP